MGIPGLEIARLSGVNYSSLSLFETGNAKPTERQLTAIQKALLKAIKLRITKLSNVVGKLEATNDEGRRSVGARSSGGDGEPDAPGIGQ